MLKSKNLRAVVLVGVPILLFIGLVVFSTKPMEITFKTVKAKVNNSEYSLEVADTNQLRAQGLMNRAHMDRDKGMLFIFDRDGIYTFWMKNTLIALDMLWLDADYSVVYIAKNVPPCEEAKTPRCPSYSPGVAARYVVELNAGVADTYGIKVGDNFEIVSD